MTLFPTLTSTLKPTISSLVSSGGGGVPAFVSTWDTTKLSTGSSTSSQIKIPTVSGGTYNCVVDWGDGNFSTITTWNDAAWTHTYDVSGEKTIRITGTFKGIYFANTGDRRKLLNVVTWGQAGNGILANADNAFNGCESLTSLGDLDMSNVTRALAMMSKCFEFTQDVGFWDVSNLSVGTSMFQSRPVGAAPASWLDSIYNNWTLRPLQPNVTIDFGSAQYSRAGAAGRKILTDAPNTWNILDGGHLPFVSTWDTTKTSTGSSSATSIKIPTVSGGTYDCTVDWGDGSTSTITTWDDPAWTHTYASSGVKTISITGVFKGFAFLNTGDRRKLLSVLRWGPSGNSVLANADNALYGCDNLTSLGDMETGHVTRILQMMVNTPAFTQTIGHWDVRALTVANSFMLNATPATRSTAWVDNLYSGWGAQAVQSGVNFSLGTAKYSAAGAAGRAALITKGWTITDGGMV